MAASIFMVAALITPGWAANPTTETQLGSEPSAFEIDALACDTSQAFVCSPDAAFFAAVTAAGRITYCRLADGIVLRTYYLCAPHAVAFSTDGKLLAGVGFSCQQPIITVWRLSDGQTVLRGENPLNSLEHVEFTRDGKSLIGWDRQAGSTVWALSGDLR